MDGLRSATKVNCRRSLRANKGTGGRWFGPRAVPSPAAEVGGEWGKVRCLRKLDGWVVMVDLHQVYDAALHQNAGQDDGYGNNQGAMSDAPSLDWDDEKAGSHGLIHLGRCFDDRGGALPETRWVILNLDYRPVRIYFVRLYSFSHTLGTPATVTTSLSSFHKPSNGTIHYVRLPATSSRPSY